MPDRKNMTPINQPSTDGSQIILSISISFVKIKTSQPRYIITQNGVVISVTNTKSPIGSSVGQRLLLLTDRLSSSSRKFDFLSSLFAFRLWFDLRKKKPLNKTVISAVPIGTTSITTELRCTHIRAQSNVLVTTTNPPIFVAGGQRSIITLSVAVAMLKRNQNLCFWMGWPSATILAAYSITSKIWNQFAMDMDTACASGTSVNFDATWSA